jgi:hypothetical protein
MNPALFSNMAAGQTASGISSIGEVTELRKALEAGYGTDISQLTGGGALRIQSLDKTMKATIQENRHFALFNNIAKSNATATIDEWTEQSGVGGFLGGSTNTELGVISQANGQYDRRYGSVKYMMTRCEISAVLANQNAIISAEAAEYHNASMRLLSDAEFLCFEGDDRIVPTEFNGIAMQMRELDSVDHIINMEAQPLNNIAPIDRAASVIAGMGNFGVATHLYMSQQTQSDFNTNLDPAFRVALTDVPNGGISVGAPVVGIRTSWGDIKTVPDVFIRDESRQGVFELVSPQNRLLAAKNLFKPATVTAVADESGGVDTKWGENHAGMYYYAVTGVNSSGQSQALVSAQVAVVKGGKVTLTIAASAGGEETGYVIYRGRKNGTNELSDLREMCKVPRTGNTTVYVDKNRQIPGTTKAFLLNMMPGSDAITWRQYLPMTKFPLYPVNQAVIPWAQMLFGYLRIAKRRHHVMFENVLPTGAQWRPFN